VPPGDMPAASSCRAWLCQEGPWLSLIKCLDRVGELMTQEN
jgi:hypothetical protein